MLCVLAASGPATVGLYFFSRETTIGDAAQLISSITGNKIYSLNVELQLARKSLEKFRDHLLSSLQALPTDEEQHAFDLDYVRQPNGMITSDRSRFDGRSDAGVFLNPATPQTPFMKTLHLRTQRLMSIYGSAVVPPFDSLWMLTRWRSEVVYMPRVPNMIFRTQTSDDYGATDWLTLGDPAVNQDRGLRWTKASYDFVTWSWMVSAVLPIDHDGTWIGTIGHDIFIKNLLGQLTQNDSFKGTEHFLIGPMGEPILAGSRQAAFEAGTLTLADKLAIKNIITSLRRYAPAKTDTPTIYRFDVAGVSSIVVTETIAETGWIYYRVVPISSIVGRIKSAFIWTAAIAIAAMLLIAFAVHLSLRRHIVKPVRELATIVGQFAEGNTDVRAPLRSDDEIGHLAAAFNTMANRIHQSHSRLTQVQQDLRRQNQDLLRASRIKSNFLANMSHELRTPLNAILGFADVMQAELFGPLGSARYKEYTVDIRRSGQHLLALINDVLDMSRIEAGRADLDLSVQDLIPITQASIAMVRTTAESKAIVIRQHFPQTRMDARCDSRAVTQMLLNLLSNAIKFSPLGSEIVVTVQKTDDGGSEIIVEDPGPGITEAMLPHLFEPFSPKAAHIASNHQGTGLGLSITKGLIEAHGGRIEVWSVHKDGHPSAMTPTPAGSGTTMKLVFPPCPSNQVSIT
ncbi:MAG: ATP-binding protein [Dongiaceae bacterium]